MEPSLPVLLSSSTERFDHMCLFKQVNWTERNIKENKPASRVSKSYTGSYPNTNRTQEMGRAAHASTKPLRTPQGTVP